MVERPIARFPLAAFAAALFLIAELARPRRRRIRANDPVSLPPGEKPRSPGAAAAGVAVLALLCGAGPGDAHAQSNWAKGDAAFRKEQWAQAESLYAARARSKGSPAAVRVNLATARARQGNGDSALVDLSRLTAEQGSAGRAAGYNLGTLYGEAKDYERGLRELRRALERDPSDADARWNYELLKRMQRDQQKKQDPKSQPQTPDPSPQQPAGGGQGNGGQPDQKGPQAAPQAPQPSNAPPEQRPGQAQGMSREQAERLLGSLRELERSERQRMRRGQAQQDRRGKDW